MYLDYLARLGVEVKAWLPKVAIPSRYGGDAFGAIRDGSAELDLSDLANANVLVFSRWSNTSPACSECGRDCATPDGLARHRESSGHASLGMDPVLRLLAPALLGDRALRAGCAVLYDLDDDLFHQPRWVGHTAGLQRELDLVELLLRSADLVTVTTPALAAAVSPYTTRAQVVRNAIEPGLYARVAGAQGAAPAESPTPPEQVRVLFYGAEVRVRDYESCRTAVDRVASADARVRRVWLGASSRRVHSLVDEAYPYAGVGVPFATALASTRPNVGLAPLRPDQFAQAKSELHWLEYSAVGAATVATRLSPEGPYDVIRDGVDGLLAESPGQWARLLADLTASSALRSDLAGRARERVAAEYRAERRALEWAAVYRWVAAHPGIGLPPGGGIQGRPEIS